MFNWWDICRKLYHIGNVTNDSTSVHMIYHLSLSKWYTFLTLLKIQLFPSSNSSFSHSALYHWRLGQTMYHCDTHKSRYWSSDSIYEEINEIMTSCIYHRLCSNQSRITYMDLHYLMMQINQYSSVTSTDHHTNYLLCSWCG